MNYIAINIQVIRQLQTLRRFILIINLVGLTALSQAGTPLVELAPIKFRNFNANNGLPGENIHAIHQDPSGLLWFGLDYEGLVSFDGENFDLFRHQASEAHSLSGNFINCITNDEKGNLWVGTDNGLNKKRIGPFYYDSQQFTRFFVEDGTGLVGNEILSIRVTSKNELLIGTDQGLCRLIKDDRFEKIDLNILNEPRVQAIYQTAKGNLYVGTDQGLYLLGDDFHIMGHWRLANGRTLNILSLEESPSGDLWVGARSLYVFDMESGEFTIIDDLIGTGPSIPSGIRDLRRDKKGQMWVGTGRGVYVFTSLEVPYQLIRQEAMSIGGFVGDRVRNVYHDRQGSTWISVMNAGLNFHDLRSEALDQIIPFSGALAEIDDNGILSLNQDGRGNLYIGSRRLGLTIYDLEKGTSVNYSLTNGTADGLASDRIESILIADDDLIVLGGTSGLSTFQPSTQTFQQYRTHTVRTLTKDSSGVIWIGKADGLYLSTNPAKVMERFRPDDTINPVRSDIFVLYWSKDGHLWIGCTYEGLMEYNPDTDEITWYNNPEDQASYGLESKQVRTIYEAPDGTMWIGTKLGGIYSFDRKNRVFTHVPDSVFQGSAFGINGDEEGNLWIRASNDVCKYSPQTNSLERYGRGFGLYGVTSHYMSQDGILFFGSHNSVTFFDPENFKKPPNLSRINIKSVTCESGNSEWQIEGNEYRFPYGSFISFDFFLDDFSSPTENVFAYKLNGQNKDWTYSGHRNQVSYANLQPGSYTFSVKGANPDGFWSQNVADLEFTILPPWWLTNWAKVIYVILFSLLLYSIYRIATYRTRKENELNKLRLEREHAETLNKHKLRFFTNISHELRTPLTLLLPSALKFTNGRDLAPKDIRKHSGVIVRSANTLLSLVNELMEFRTVEEGMQKFVPVKTDIRKFCTQIFEEFDVMAAEKDLNYDIKFDSIVMEGFIDRKILTKVLRNLISNAIKYTPERGTVTLEISETMLELGQKQQSESGDSKVKGLVIRVMDTGIGISQEQLEYVFDRFYRADDKPHEVGGTGIGLDLVKSLVALHNGHIEVTSTKNEGSTFIVQVPIVGDDSAPAPEEAEIDEALPVTLKSTSQMEQGLEVPKQADKILIVEDDPNILEMLHEIFSEDYDIMMAENGAKGYEKALEFPQPNLIISDVVMPEMNGLELCAMIKKNFKTSHIPILMLTARSAVSDELSGLESGANDYITKPFHPDILVAKVNSILAGQRLLKERFLKEGHLNPSEIDLPDPDKEFLDQCVKTIENYMSDQEFGVETFAKDVGLSRTQLFRKLKYLVDMSPSEMIYSVRLKRAADILKVDSLNVSEVAYMVGFSSPSSFTAAFKKRYKVSPREYVQQHVDLSS